MCQKAQEKRLLLSFGIKWMLRTYGISRTQVQWLTRERLNPKLPWNIVGLIWEQIALPEWFESRAQFPFSQTFRLRWGLWRKFPIRLNRNLTSEPTHHLLKNCLDLEHLWWKTTKTRRAEKVSPSTIGLTMTWGKSCIRLTTKREWRRWNYHRVIQVGTTPFDLSNLEIWQLLSHRLSRADSMAMTQRISINYFCLEFLV